AKGEKSPAQEKLVKIPVPTRSHREGSHLSRSEENSEMSKRNKTRPGPARTQRQRSIPADGIYNNAPFMHAATSHVGNIVQIQTPAGHIYEGVFRTFSSQFQIVLEMAHRVEIGPDQKPKINVESFVERLIFKPNDIVTLVSKDVDPEYATKNTFKTDTAISRCNGTSWLEDRELEPWDGSGVNGDPLEHSLELDSNAVGWDPNEMFQKNEQVYGVQSTFDQSLSGYTVQIHKKDSDEFKEQELEAEKIANEIENNPVYKERIDIENGDEEAAFAAVVRPASNVSPREPIVRDQSVGGAPNDKNANSVTSGSNSSSSSGGVGGNSSASSSSNGSSSSNVASSNSSSNGNQNLASNTSNSANNNPPQAMPSNTKYIVPAKRKPGQGGKLVRSTPPPLTNSNNNNGGPPVVTSQQQQQQQQQQPPSPQAPHKNSYGQMMSQQQQQPPPGSQQHGGGMGHGPPGPQYGMHPNQSPYGHVQHQQQQQPPQHGQASVMNANKMNGDGRGDMAGGPPGGGGGGGGNMNVNNNQKPLPQRAVRQYQSAPAPVTYSEPPPSLNPQQMPVQMQPMSTKPPMHMAHPPHHTGVHLPPPAVVPAEHVVIQQHPMAMPPPVQQQQPPPPQQQQQQAQQVQVPPPQPQRMVTVRNRDMEIDNLRKFGQDFKLAPPQQQPPMPNVHQQPPPTVQQGPPTHNVVVQQQPPPQQQPVDHSSPPSLDSSPPLVAVNNQQQQQGKMVPAPHNEPPPQTHVSQPAPMSQQQNQASQTASGMVVVPGQLASQSPHLVQQPPPPVTQQQQQQQPPPQPQPGQQPPPVVVGGSPPQQQQQTVVAGGGVPPNGQQTVATSTVPPGSAAPNGNANGVVGTSDGSSANGGNAGGDQKPSTAAKKPFALNPAAKPFTPRSPSTPNPSRPHTPQTPGPVTIAPSTYQPPSPHVIPQQFVMSYVVNPSSFQTAQQHPHAAQQTRIRNGRQVPVGASQMQVAAATGQPLLAPSPLQMITPYGPTIHTQPFQPAPPFHQQYRIYDTPQPAQLQYLAATPPSTTPSPGQPHQQYHPGPQPSPAGGGPPTYQAVHHQQPTPYPLQVCPLVPQQVVPAIYQNIPSAPQQNHHQQNLHVMHVAQHPSAQ
uniref:LsmAD domain-containing protein n=1 Tax=Anopheles dirus TaxID=7168 RepID=A0A182N4J7_9DIPT